MYFLLTLTLMQVEYHLTTTSVMTETEGEMDVSPQIHTFKTIRHLLLPLLFLRTSLQRCDAPQCINQQ